MGVVPHMQPPTIGIVTDSSSQITPDLAERFTVEVVPLVITIDGVDYEEGVDIDADGFYEHFAGRATPEVSTSQPSVGTFAAAYRRIAERDCDEVWSIHLSSAMSGTVGTAQLAAREVDVPVHVIDTETASFGLAVCVWAAAVAAERGANQGDVRRRIDGLVERMGTAFMVGVPLLTQRGGRAAGVELDGDGVPVLTMERGELTIADRVSTVEDTIDVMAAYVAERTPADGGVTVAIGTADEPSRPLSARLAKLLTGISGIDEVVHYRVGPSVGAHTGPGTFGLFVFPTIR